ncbi:MAG: helix-hairpin-helix domain-containing protein [Acholeplasmataceae bacterium]
MKKLIIPTGVIAFFIVSAIIFISRPKKETYTYQTPKIINVEIYGDINFPGKYQVLEYMTLSDLINFSQGVKPTADLSEINLNEILQANHRYYIPSTVESLEKPNQYNLNDVNYNILITIPNITETRAINILTYREQVGKFQSVEELLNVKGIGEVTYNKIKDYFFIR